MPDLFELTVETPAAARAAAPATTRWVLKTDFNPGPIIGFSGARYFVGRFDGERFVADAAGGGPHVLDGGADFYAAQSWSSAPGGRRTWIAWMSNWKYAMVTPTSPAWRDDRAARRAAGGGRGQRRRRRDPARAAAGRRARGAAWRAPARPRGREREQGGGAARRRHGRRARREARRRAARRDERDARGPRGRGGAHRDHALDPAGGTLALDRSQSGYAGFDRKFPAGTRWLGAKRLA
ncbi:MAG: hypothetical protein IPK07_19115 [Deltaproteobacteria bacterium]|nr:hypothetical protein [Deltaproteobacteria bacterium]